jgi:hypothetical protein
MCSPRNQHQILLYYVLLNNILLRAVRQILLISGGKISNDHGVREQGRDASELLLLPTDHLLRAAHGRRQERQPTAPGRDPLHGVQDRQ